MAKYRAQAQLYVGTRLVNTGDTFESDAVPGSQWEPLDDEGRSAYDKRHAKPSTAKPSVKGDAVVIPDGWEDLKPEQRINLARQLGAPVTGTTAAKADKLIEAEVEKRAKAAKADDDQKDA